MKILDWQTTDTQYIDIAGCRLEVRCHAGPVFKKAVGAASATASGPVSAPTKAPTKLMPGNLSGSQDRPVIVLLHEGLGSIELWRQFPALLSEATGCCVFTYSRAGYGNSDPVSLPRPLDYMTKEAVDVLPLVLDAVGQRKFILVGHSDGASIAAINAGSTTDYRVRGLVLLAPHFFTEKIALTSIARARQKFLHGGLRGRLARYHKHVDVAFNGWCDAWLDPEFVHWNIADCIDYLRIPVLAVQGDADEYGTLAQIEEIKARISAPFGETIIPDCGHSPHLQAADVTLAAISRFIQHLIAMESRPV